MISFLLLFFSLLVILFPQKEENIQIAQEALYQRSQFNSEATSGKYNSENENKI